jgi:hypothetical protein
VSDKRSLLVVLDGDGRFVTAVLRPAKRPKGTEIRAFLRRLIRAIRANWPKTRILIRADSHYCCPEVIDFCRERGLDFILGVAPTTTLRRHIEELEASTKARFEAGAKTVKLRRFKAFFDGAKSWSRVERIIARVEAGEQGTPAPDKGRRPGDRDEDPDPATAADQLSLSHFEGRSRPAAAPRHLNDGRRPPNEPAPSTANTALLAANLKWAASARRSSAKMPHDRRYARRILVAVHRSG